MFHLHIYCDIYLSIYLSIYLPVYIYILCVNCQRYTFLCYFLVTCRFTLLYKILYYIEGIGEGCVQTSLEVKQRPTGQLLSIIHLKTSDPFVEINSPFKVLVPMRHMGMNPKLLPPSL